MIIHGDCIEEMAKLPANSIDAIVTDQPYGLGFMGKKWDTFTARGLQRFTRKWGRQAMRVMKPGAFGLDFGGSRTHHRITCGLEDAGLLIRDTIMWLYISGFPKTFNLAEAIDKYLGHKIKREGMRYAPDGKPYSARQIEGHAQFSDEVFGKMIVKADKHKEYIPTSDEAKLWYDYSNVLKPAWEPIILFQKPREKTYANNILKYGVGGLNIGGCRVPIDPAKEGDKRIHEPEKNIHRAVGEDGRNVKFHKKQKGRVQQMFNLKGRYPSNVIIDDMVAELFDLEKENFSRYFYCPKALKSERQLGSEEVIPKSRDTTRTKPIDNPFNRNKPVKNIHPTVKPIKLMTYLVNLVRPPTERPVILDPFGGSGSTLIACKILNCDCIIIEQNSDYVDIIRRRDSIPLHRYQKFTNEAIPQEGQVKLNL